MQTNMLVSQTIDVLMTDYSLEGCMHITILCANVPHLTVF